MADRYALNGFAFTIRFFIGQVPDGHHSTIAQALTQVGEIYNFSDPVEMDRSGCENCKKNMAEKLKTTGQIPLTNALLTRFKQQIPHENDAGEHSVLKSMTPEDVVPFLKQHFHWRVTDVRFMLDSRSCFGNIALALPVAGLLTRIFSMRASSSIKPALTV